MPMHKDFSTIPQFETCQFILSEDGLILSVDEDVYDKINVPQTQLEGKNFSDLLIQINPHWKGRFDEKFWNQSRFNPLFLPWLDATCKTYPTGIYIYYHPFKASNGLIHNKQPDFDSHLNSKFENIKLKKEDRGPKSRGSQDNAKVYITLAPGLASHQDLTRFAYEDIPLHPSNIEQMFLRLQASENRLASYVRNFPGIYFKQRPDFSFNYIHPEFEYKIGIPVESLYKNGSRFLHCIHERDQKHFLLQLEKHIDASQTFSITYRMRNPQDGKIVHFLDVRTPLFSQTGLLLGYEGILLDNTDQAIAEARIANLTWKENMAFLTSGLIHDFSNVIAGITVLSELYCDQLEQSDPIYSGMQQIQKSSLQAQKIIRRIMDLNRSQSCEKSYHYLEALIEDQVDLIKIILPKQTQLQTIFTGKTLPVYIDEIGFRQMLLNLAINARDAIVQANHHLKNKSIQNLHEDDFPKSIPGKITIQVQEILQGETMLQGTYGGERIADTRGIQIDFKDNGCGIPENHLEKVFSPAFSTKGIHEGSGFGLYNIMRFIEDNEGFIGLKSKVDAGTTFKIFLPLATSKNDFNHDQCTLSPLVSGSSSSLDAIRYAYSQGPSSLSSNHSLHRSSLSEPKNDTSYSDKSLHILVYSDSVQKRYDSSHNLLNPKGNSIIWTSQFNGNVTSFSNMTSIKAYLEDSPFSPDCFFIMATETDPNVEVLIDYLKEYYPEIKRMIQIIEEERPDQKEKMTYSPSAKYFSWRDKCDSIFDTEATSCDIIRAIRSQCLMQKNTHRKDKIPLS